MDKVRITLEANEKVHSWTFTSEAAVSEWCEEWKKKFLATPLRYVVWHSHVTVDRMTTLETFVQYHSFILLY